MSGGTCKGDWICGDQKCANLNFARREKCNKCGTSKKKGHSAQTGIEIGKEIAEKSKGLFSADDWQCKSCGNINWARRSTCNVCNASKVNHLGERTGFGGGFMEREEIVEYKRPRDDSSDDEFDEFGRKKKKFRRLPSNSGDDSKNGVGAHPRDSDPGKRTERKPQQSSSNNRQLGNVDKEETDEEESGDEADLAKYDVWGAASDDDGENDTSDDDTGDYNKNGKDIKVGEVNEKQPSDTKKRKTSSGSSSSSSSSLSSSGSSDSRSSSSSSSKQSRGSLEKRDRLDSTSPDSSQPTSAGCREAVALSTDLADVVGGPAN